MVSLLIWISVGAIAGWIASMLVNTDRKMGFVSNVIVGMLGSLIGGTVVILLDTGRLDLTNTSYSDLNLMSIIVSVIGAVILLVLIKALRK